MAEAAKFGLTPVLAPPGDAEGGVEVATVRAALTGALPRAPNAAAQAA